MNAHMSTAAASSPRASRIDLVTSEWMAPGGNGIRNASATPIVSVRGGICSHRRKPQHGPNSTAPSPRRHRLGDSRIRLHSTNLPAPDRTRLRPAETTKTTFGVIEYTNARRMKPSIILPPITTPTHASILRSRSARSQV